jgi:SAM-dependent methyltransferase
MTTDTEWQAWGARDPYFAVLTNPKYRTNALTQEARIEFFESGGRTVDYVLETCRRHINSNFAPRRILDFGCGVARMSIHFATHAEEVVAMDVAESMLAQARANCAEFGRNNVLVTLSDDALSNAAGQFDLVHSCLVLQHIEVPRGRQLFGELVRRVAPGGCGVIQITFGWEKHADTYGVVPIALPPEPETGLINSARGAFTTAAKKLGLAKDASPSTPDLSPRDPEMQMNYYNLSELMFILQQSGVVRVVSDITNHGGALGAFMFFEKPSNIEK